MNSQAKGSGLVGYNVQTAVDAEYALIVAHAVTLDAGDNRQLEPMAEAAQSPTYTESSGPRLIL